MKKTYTMKVTGKREDKNGTRVLFEQERTEGAERVDFTQRFEDEVPKELKIGATAKITIEV